MAEHYITRTDEQGSVSIAEDVIAAIVSEAIYSVDGVNGLSASFGGEIVERLGKKSAVRGVKVSFVENEVEIDIFFLVQYGAQIIDVSKKTQEAVVSNVEAITGLTVRQVNVTVCGIAFEKAK